MFQKSPHPLDLFETLIHLRDDGSAEPSARGGAAGAGLWTVAAHRADDDAALHSDVWERHPTGDEVLCVLSGALAVHLRDHGDGSEPFATLTAGRSFVVPAGHWHRLTVVEPAELLAITPRPGTRHERTDRGGPARADRHEHAPRHGPSSAAERRGRSGAENDGAVRRTEQCGGLTNAED